MARQVSTAVIPSASLFGTPLDPRSNSLNLIRLCLAATVLFTHSYALIGRIDDTPIFADKSPATWAVAGFFAISGYLITASRQRTALANFLLHRIARIYPAFFVCLIVIVTVFAPLAFWIRHATLIGYFDAEPSPLSFLFSNMFLWIGQYPIGDTLSTVPWPDAWNGSLWTLYYEFLCYLFIAALLIWGYARKNPIPVIVAFAISVLVYANLDFFLPLLDENHSFEYIATLLPYFLAGAVVRLLSPRIGLHWIPGLLSLPTLMVAVYFGPGWFAQLFAPLLAYGLLWVSSVLPQPQWVARNDISYGVYIYAFPVQQLFVLLGLGRFGATFLSFSALLVTVALASLSWFVVEQPILQRTRMATGRKRPSAGGSESPVLALKHDAHPA